MKAYESMDKMKQKAEWEGGWAEFILDYGVDLDELPPDAPEGLADAIRAFTTAWDQLLSIVEEEKW